ncbi:hypothetical protein [Eshraghiella crossota]|jgi:hypothetical protein|uniref:hypothetical protein n=1 Tax=Eshraghiella crossota TaxID=45851 RepID=UPI003AB50147
MQISSNYSMNGVPYETGSVYFRPSTGICSEKHRGSEGLHERKRILCCVSGKIGKVIIDWNRNGK